MKQHFTVYQWLTMVGGLIVVFTSATFVTITYANSTFELKEMAKLRAHHQAVGNGEIIKRLERIENAILCGDPKECK